MNEMVIEIPENFSVYEADRFRESVNNLIIGGKINFVLNFKQCNVIDSTGLGVLVSLYKKCLERNGCIKLASLNTQVLKVFNLTRLDKVFEIQN